MATEILQALGLDFAGAVGLSDMLGGTRSSSSGREWAEPESESEAEAEPEPVSKYDPYSMDVVGQLDLGALFAGEEGEYVSEREGRSELYVSMRYLEVFDAVVDRWRAEEVGKLRRRAEMRRAEIGRLLDADRAMALSNYRNGLIALLRARAYDLRHRRWAAESEINRAWYHKPKSRAMAKVEAALALPPHQGRGRGRGWGADPRARADVVTIRRLQMQASRTPQPQPQPQPQEEEEEEEDALSEVSSLPSFTTVYTDTDTDTDTGTDDESWSEASASDSDEDESLLSRSLRMALQSQSQSQTQTQTQTQAQGSGSGSGSGSGLGSGLLKRKRSPPSGVRWWKAGQVQSQTGS